MHKNISFFGGIAAKYSPKDLCRFILRTTLDNLHTNPVMSNKDLSDTIKKMEYLIDHCIIIDGQFGLEGHELFTCFEIQFTSNLVKKALNTGLEPLQMSYDVLMHAHKLFLGSSIPSIDADFEHYTEPSGHIWFLLKGKPEEYEHKWLKDVYIFVEAIDTSIRVVFGESGDEFYRHDIF